MEFLNGTAMLATYTVGLDPDGCDRLVVVVKGSFTVEPGRDVLVPAPAPDVFVHADTFTGEPGASATIRECDFALFKPRCDVLVLGPAFAPGGRPASRVIVGLAVGALAKRFEVVGPRRWQRGLGGVVAGAPEPFTSHAIAYDQAFGGTTLDKDGAAYCYGPNPVGVGAWPRAAQAVSQPLPNTQDLSAPVESPTGRYRPLALGPVSRHAEPRRALAGTYDRHWVEHVRPYLPRDFDVRYFQAAPDDQQIEHPRGGEAVVLTNLTPEGSLRFVLPTIMVPVEFVPHRGPASTREAKLDTLEVSSAEGRVTLTWRVSWPLRSNILELAEVVVGVMPAGFYRARAQGKVYLRSLREVERLSS